MTGIQIGHGESVTLHRWTSGPPDRYGKPTATWVDSVVTGVGVDSPNASETGRGTDQEQTVAVQIFLPAGMVCAKQDQFTVRGLRYEVDGEAPMAIKNFFTGTVFPTPVKLKRVTG